MDKSDSSNARQSESTDEDSFSSVQYDPATATNSQPPRRTGWLPGFMIGITALGLTLFGIFWVFKDGFQASETSVLTQKVRRGDLVVSVIEQGTLESSNNTEIKCKVRGYSVVTWVVPAGTMVEPGDELVRLDTKRIEDAIGKHTTDAHVARSTFERTKADLAQAEIAEEAYLKGAYKTQLQALEKTLEAAKSDLKNAEELLVDSQAMFRKGYVTKLEVEAYQFNVKQAQLELKVRQTAIDVLNQYTKQMRLETLRGQLRATKSKYKADEAGLRLDEGRRDRAIQELEYCVIKAERKGMVVYPSQAAWKKTPDVTEGANVRKDQVLLLMPDLTQMQIKVAIHESLVDRIRRGLKANVTLPEMEVEGAVQHVATVAAPAGWWNGNMVKYDTIVELPSVQGLKPGMSAEVEIIIKVHEDVLSIPVAAVVETEHHQMCWVKTEEGIKKRILKLGDSNDVMIIVKSGLREGDDVILNPLKFVDEAEGQILENLNDLVEEPTALSEDADSKNTTAASSGTSGRVAANQVINTAGASE